jgi:hypothetical protein
LGDMIDYALDDLGPFLKRLSVAIGNGVTLPCDFPRVVSKFRNGWPCAIWAGGCGCGLDNSALYYEE